MVVTVEAKKLNLCPPFHHPKVITCLIYEPTSLSLALMHSDYSFSLISPFNVDVDVNVLAQQTLIPPPNSSACFVPVIDHELQECPHEKDVVFVTAGPHCGGSKVVLRFYKGKGGKFGRAHVGCTQNGVCFDERLGGVVVDVSHGMKVVLSGCVNYFVMYSASAAKVMVFGVRLVEGGGLRLVKCAVIECRVAVSSICVSFGVLVLGELRGARVFPLRGLVKGRVGSRRKSRVARGKVESSNGGQLEGVGGKLEGRKLKMPNGFIRPFEEGHELDKNGPNVNPSKLLGNGHAYNVVDGVHSNSSADGNHDVVKPRSLRLQQDSGEWGMQFVMFNDSTDEGVKSEVLRYKTIKAISIQAVSRQKFLILDSFGDLHVLNVLKSGSVQMRHLPGTIQVQRLAAFPDTSANSHTVWISDGLHSVHTMTIPGSDATENEIDGSNDEGKIIHSSVTQAIFLSESIQDMIPVGTNTVLILGQDGLYAYANS